MDRLHSISRLIALAFFAALLPFSAQADGASWQIEKMSGDVRVLSEDAQPVSLGAGRALSEGSVIETGTDGRVILSRGDESIVVSPNTSLSLAPESNRGMMTTILQRMGTILLSVDKKDRQHFEVETPYLAAVVKGTKFTVTVDGKGSAVHVVEGAVEVIDLGTGDVGLIRPGQTAQSFASAAGGLSVSGPGAAPVERGADKSRAEKGTNVKPVPATETPKSAAAPVRIESGMSAALDIGKATNGLARGIGQSVAAAARQSAGEGLDEDASSATGLALGASGNAPGLAVAGLSDSAPGLSGAAPGLSGAAPGLSGAAPGLSGAAPGLSGSAPGLSGSAPGLSGAAPGLANAAAGAANGAAGAASSVAGAVSGVGNPLPPGLGGNLPPGLGGSNPGNGGGNGNGQGNGNGNGRGNS
jgi:hypothetical protein